MLIKIVNITNQNIALFNNNLHIVLNTLLSTKCRTISIIFNLLSFSFIYCKYSICVGVRPGFPGVEKHRLEIISILTHYSSSQVHLFNNLKILLDYNILQIESLTFLYQSDLDANTVKNNNEKLA